MVNATLTGIYTLTPTHCGTGQAQGAVDLPIARESSTGFPILPATSLKGVARAAFELERYRQAGASLEPFTRETIDVLFGPTLEDDEESEEREEERTAQGEQVPTTSGSSSRTSRSKRQRCVGNLVMGEGHLIAYPFRALHSPLVFGTCRLLLERLERQLRGLGLQLPRSGPDLRGIVKALADESLDALLVRGDKATEENAKSARTRLQPNPNGNARAIVIEDRIFPTDQVMETPSVADLGMCLAELLPTEETIARARITASLVVLPDSVFAELVARVTPVNARIKLTSGKTTSEFRNPHTDKPEKGSLWYEETLPSDCLFWSVIQARTGYERAKPGRPQTPVEDFCNGAGVLRHMQIGGNETVGQGFCWWHIVGRQQS